MQAAHPPPAPFGDLPAVLVVEDNDMYRSVIMAALGQYLQGCAIVEATSVNHAMRALAARPMEVVVADMTLPDGTALTLVEAAKDHIRDGLKVIIFSNHSSEDMLPLLRRADVHAYVEKAQGPRHLANAIQLALDDRSSAPPPVA